MEISAQKRKQIQIQGQNSRPFDVHRWADYPKLNNCLTYLVSELEAAQNRQRVRTDRNSKKFRDAVRCLVLDLYVAWATDPELLVGVPRGKDHFGGKTRYANLFLTYSQFRAAFDGLKNLGYIEVVLDGFNDRRTGKSYASRVRATQKLIQLLDTKAKFSTAALEGRPDNSRPEVIILKDENKTQIDYKDTPLTHRMRKDLGQINAQMDRSWIDLELSDKDFQQLQHRMLGDAVGNKSRTGILDLTSKHLYRVFNNGTWTDGGRFYGGWWQTIPQEYRKFITINDKQTSEVDYSRFHPHMLYAEAGTEMNGDAYQVPGLIGNEALVKRTFNKLVNAEGRMGVDAEFDATELGMTWGEFIERILKHHEPIRKFMRSGYGVKLQRKDADIANEIMLRFLKMDYTCLPVHDSFIVHHALRQELEEIMVEEYVRVFGSKIGYKVKPVDEFIATGNTPIDHDEALNEAFGLQGDFKGFNNRRINWRNHSDNRV